MSAVVIRQALKQGGLFESSGKLQQAWQLYEKLYARFPTEKEVVHALARVEQNRGRFKRAQLLYKSLLKAKNDSDTSILLAQCYSSSGFYWRAKRVLCALIKEGEGPATAALQLAKLLVSLEKHEHAIKYWEQCAELEPKQFIGWFGLAKSFEALERPAEAIEPYKEALSIGNGREKAAVIPSLSLCMFKAEQAELAMQLLRNADASLVDGSLKAVEKLAVGYNASGQNELAYFLFHYVNQNKASLGALLSESEYLDSQQGYEQSKALIDKAIELDGRNPFIKFRMADHYYAQALYNAALESIEDLPAAKVNTTQAKHIRAKSLYCLYEFEKAEKLLLELLQENSQDRVAHIRLAYIYFTRCDWVKAFQHYQFRIDEQAAFEGFVQMFPFVQKWNAKNALKSLMLVDEQGLGDRIRYSIFYAALSEHVESIYLVTDIRLKALLERSFERLTVLPQYDVPPIRESIELKIKDVFAPPDLGILFPQVVNTTPAKLLSLDKLSGFLKADESGVVSNNLALSGKGKMKIGICWRGPVALEGREDWYMTVEEVVSIFAGFEQDICLVPLQYQITDEENAYLNSAGFGYVGATHIDMRDDLDGMADLISSLDLVITPATAICELAGALGVPVWLFATQDRSKANLDGNYMQGFYPNISILFSKEPWKDVVADMNAALKADLR